MPQAGHAPRRTGCTTLPHASHCLTRHTASRRNPKPCPCAAQVLGAGVECRVQGAGCRVQGAGCRVQGAEFRRSGEQALTSCLPCPSRPACRRTDTRHPMQARMTHATRHTPHATCHTPHATRHSTQHTVHSTQHTHAQNTNQNARDTRGYQVRPRADRVCAAPGGCVASWAWHPGGCVASWRAGIIPWRPCTGWHAPCRMARTCQDATHAALL